MHRNKFWGRIYLIVHQLRHHVVPVRARVERLHLQAAS